MMACLTSNQEVRVRLFLKLYVFCCEYKLLWCANKLSCVSVLRSSPVLPHIVEKHAWLNVILHQCIYVHSCHLLF